MAGKTIKSKKNTKTVKGELLKLLRQKDAVEESDFDIKNIVDQQEAINKLKHYDEQETRNKRTRNKNNMRYESIQGQMLEKFKETEGFVENVGLSQSTIYFKNRL